MKSLRRKDGENFLLLLALFLIVFPHEAGAISMSKNSFTIGESITVLSKNSPGNTYFLYDVTNRIILGGAQSVPLNLASVSWNDAFPVVDNDYAVVEVATDVPVCEEEPDTYEQCKARPEFVGEVLFSIINPARPAVAKVGGGPTQYRPEAEITSPKDGDVSGSALEIHYRATDRNDGGEARERFGLIHNPVSLFYTDALPGVWDHRRIPDEDKKIIAKDLPAEGVYPWAAKNVLREGEPYRIIANAEDLFGDIGENISGLFSVDVTPPVFTVRVDPPIARGAEVKIIIEPSEKLSEAPKNFIKQRNYTEIQIYPRQVNNHYEASYEVRPGHDGTAVISVSGKDVVGNEGNLIVEGGTFSVGLEPPPQPLVASPLDHDIVSQEIIAIRGSTREDTTIVIFLNDEKIREIKPQPDSIFTAEGITLSRTFNRGVNILKIIAEDQAGNFSEPVSLQIKFNIAPVLTLEFPKPNDMVEGTTTIRVSARDENNDRPAFTDEVSNDAGKTWTMLAEGIQESRFLWNTAEFPDGEYRLRITADDGFEKIQLVSEPFTVENFLPVISFADGGKLVTGAEDISLEGVAITPERAGIRRQTIKHVEYSIDDGVWLAAKAEDGAFDSQSEKFSVSLGDMKEKSYVIRFRARDSRGLYGHGTKILVVDFGPPEAPIISLPHDGAVISNAEDEDPKKAGVQFTISGIAEPQSIVSARFGDSIASAQTDANGNFILNEVTLRTHGKNEIMLFATDAAENKSAEKKFAVFYNNPPKIEFISPRSGRGLNHRAIIQWDIRDPDLDQIEHVILQYRKSSGAPFITLAKNPQGKTFSWDVSFFPEGRSYELRLEAGDGISRSEKIIPVVIDHTPPAIAPVPLRSMTFRKAFTLEVRGEASDNFSGIEFVEYSIDGEHWFKALITKGYRELEASFRVRHPFVLEDGRYTIRFRSTDVAGNVSETMPTQEIIVDTTPPRIGSYTISVGNLILLPEHDLFVIPERTPVRFALSLEKDTTEASLVIGNATRELEKKFGLWEAVFATSDAGSVSLAVSAEDLSGNAVFRKEIGSIEIVPRGKIVSSQGGAPISNARITVLVRNPEDQSLSEWQAESYGLLNPIEADEDGTYQILLPDGLYELRVQKIGFQRLRVSEFEVRGARFFTPDFALEPRRGFRGFFEDFLDRIIMEVRLP